MSSIRPRRSSHHRRPLSLLVCSRDVAPPESGGRGRGIAPEWRSFPRQIHRLAARQGRSVTVHESRREAGALRRSRPRPSRTLESSFAHGRFRIRRRTSRSRTARRASHHREPSRRASSADATILSRSDAGHPVVAASWLRRHCGTLAQAAIRPTLLPAAESRRMRSSFVPLALPVPQTYGNEYDKCR